MCFIGYLESIETTIGWWIGTIHKWYFGQGKPYILIMSRFIRGFPDRNG
jgi:hypothetical protein